MKKFRFSCLFLIGAFAFTGLYELNAQSCRVADPTGTPLNVRISPNGRILQTLKNGTVVYVEETSYDSKSRPWVKISISVKNEKRVLGWVFREFISCSADTSIRSTPSNSWQTFYSNFKKAVKTRDEELFRTLLAAKYLGCNYWNFCQFTDREKSNLTPDLIFRELKKNNSQGWKDLEKILRVGILSETTEVAGSAYKGIEMSANPKCENTDLAVYFEYKEGRWWVSMFDISGCGH